MARQKRRNFAKNLSLLARHYRFNFSSYSKTGIYVRENLFTFENIKEY